MTFKNDLRKWNSKASFINSLGIDEATFDLIANFSPAKNDQTSGKYTVLSPQVFIQHRIPKKNSRLGFRTVWENCNQKNTYKALSRWLDSFFNMAIPEYPHPASFGYVIGRNISENASVHCGNKKLLKVDIREFFPSISFDRVLKLLIATKINEEVSHHLAKFLTIEEKLPLGLASSPVIANAICLPLDLQLQELAKNLGVNYSRYADDISFSSNNKLPDINSIRKIILEYGFSLAEHKTRYSKIGQAHYVTGLSISDAACPHIPKAKKRRLRQELYYAKKHTLIEHVHHLGIYEEEFIQMEVNRIDGLVKFISFHEPRLATKIKSTWADILKESGFQPSFKPKNVTSARFDIIFDETEFTWKNNQYLALGLSTSLHQSQINIATKKILDYETSDLWASGKSDSIKNNGVHYSDATEDLKLRYIETLQQLPFDGYVVFAQLSDSKQYSKIYLKLLQAIIRRRLMAADGLITRLTFEKNNKVSQNRIKELVERELSNLQKHNNRRPQCCTINFAVKPALELSVPDFLLGVMRRYLKFTSKSNNPPYPREILMFERIRDKYRVILDCDSNIEYSRRRPL